MFVQFKKYFLLYKFVLKGLRLTTKILTVNSFVNENNVNDWTMYSMNFTVIVLFLYDYLVPNVVGLHFHFIRNLCLMLSDILLSIGFLLYSGDSSQIQGSCEREWWRGGKYTDKVVHKSGKKTFESVSKYPGMHRVKLTVGKEWSRESCMLNNFHTKLEGIQFQIWKTQTPKIFNRTNARIMP